MSIVFNVILHLLLLGSLLLFVVVFIATAFARASGLERLMRVGAVFAGAMVALGATASGMNYATYTVNALAQGRPVSAAAHFFSLLVPACIGSGLGFYLVRTVKHSESMAIRILGFVGMLATTAFIEVYAQAASVNGFKLGAAALPNIGFTAGVILTVVFTLRTDGSAAQSGSRLRALAALLGRGGAGRGSAGFAAGPRPTGAQRTGDQSDSRDFRGL